MNGRQSNLKHQRTSLGIAFAISATLFYGQVPVLARLGFLNGIPAIESILLRTFVVATVFAFVSLVRRESFWISQEARRPFIWQCIATLAVSACYLMSVQFIPVGLAVIIFFAFPVIVLLLAPVIEGHAPSLIRIAVALFAFAGIAVAIGLDLSTLNPLGLILAAGSALGCALQFFSGRNLSAHVAPAAFSSLVHAAILPIMLVLALWIGDGSISVLTGKSVSGLGLLAMAGVSLCYLAGYFLHMSSVQAARASVVVPFFNLEPVISTLMAGLLLHETLAVNQMIGGAIVLAALILCGIIESNTEPA